MGEEQECGKFTHHFIEIYIIHPNLVEGNRMLSTCQLWGLAKSRINQVFLKIVPISVLHPSS